MRSPRVDDDRIIGHRGARGLFPENTIEGFQAAFALGVRAFELDVGLTADDVAVVTHDLTLNPAIARDARGHWVPAPGPAVRALTYETLRTYDVGRIQPRAAYRLVHRAQAPNDGARIPRLEDVLRALPAARFIIELKTDPRVPDLTARPEAMADATLAVITDTGAADRVIVESFDWRGPRHVRRVWPGLPLAWLTRTETVRDATLWWDGATAADGVPAAVAAEGGPYWAPAWNTLTAADVHEAHRLGLRVIPWTVNSGRASRRLIRWGVDGVITDRPDVIAAALQSAWL